MGFETEADGMPSYMLPDKEPEVPESDLNLPAPPLGYAASAQGNPQVVA